VILKEFFMIHTNRYVRAGFTLMELMIAIAILAIISAIVVPNFLRYQETARKRSAKATLRTLKGGILLYQSHVGQFPASLRELIRPPREERLAKKWEGPYLDAQEVPLDPWGNKYQYKITPGASKPYLLY
ncbi:MAG: hypothetical protein CUN55_19900, partial [Phototrophicales bacterium]